MIRLNKDSCWAMAASAAARAVIGQTGLLVWAAFPYTSFMPEQIVYSQYDIKKLKKSSVICCFSLMQTTNKAISTSQAARLHGGNNRSHLTVCMHKKI